MIRRLTCKLIPALVLLASLFVRAPAHADGRFDAPAGVAVDRQGNIYVADSGDGRIIKLSPSGAVLQAWVNHGRDFVGGEPTGIGVDRYGNVYVTDAGNETVIKYGPHGRLASQWARAGDGEFNNPQGLAIGRHGSIFVADTDNSSIEKLTPRGRILNTWSLIGRSGSTTSPQWVSIGPAGFIYATVEEPCDSCYGTYAIEKRTSDGVLQVTWGYGDTLAGIAVGGRGNVFVLDQDAGTIVKFTPGGQQIAQWGLPEIGSLSEPTGIALDARGDIYVSDTDNNRIVKVSSTGKVLAVWS